MTFDDAKAEVDESMKQLKQLKSAVTNGLADEMESIQRLMNEWFELKSQKHVRLLKRVDKAISEVHRLVNSTRADYLPPESKQLVVNAGQFLLNLKTELLGKQPFEQSPG